MESAFGGATRPVPMAVYLAMRFELDNMNLYVSKVSLDGLDTNAGESAAASCEIRDKGKILVQFEGGPLPDYESSQWQKIMNDEAVTSTGTTISNILGGRR